MSNYRLKKWYPTLPRDWEVGDEIYPAENGYPYYISVTKRGHAILKMDVEINPDYWEKV